MQPSIDNFEPDTGGTDKPQTIRGNKALRLGILLAALFALFLVLHFVVFSIRVIDVRLEFDSVANPTGEIPYTDAQIISAAGIRVCPNYFFLDESGIRRNIDSVPDLKYISIEKNFPSSMVLHVKQRQKTACMEAYGMRYLIDDEGMVLEKLGLVNDGVHPGMPSVTGLNLKNATVSRGEYIVLNNEEQLELYCQVIRNLLDLGMLYREMNDSGARYLVFSEINIADNGKVTLETSDGLCTVIMTLDERDPEGDIRPKLRTADVILSQIRNEETNSSGILEVLAVGEAVFSPNRP